MTWQNKNFKVVTKQHQNISSITKEMKNCFTFFRKWSKLALGWRWSGRKRTQPCGNHLSNRGGIQFGQFTDFGDHYHLLSRKFEFHLCQTWKTWRSNPAIYRTMNLWQWKEKPTPKRFMSLIWVIGKVKKKADVSGQSDRGLADDALTSLLRSRTRLPPFQLTPHVWFIIFITHCFPLLLFLFASCLFCLNCRPSSYFPFLHIPRSYLGHMLCHFDIVEIENFKNVS